MQKIQIKARRLKKIWKREEIEENWENFRLSWSEKRRKIAKAKKVAYYRTRKEACISLNNIWKVVRHTQNWVLR